jgi:hypothetical protein
MPIENKADITIVSVVITENKNSNICRSKQNFKKIHGKVEIKKFNE